MAAPVSFTIRPPSSATRSDAAETPSRQGASSSSSSTANVNTTIRIPIAQGARPAASHRPKSKTKDPRARIIGRLEEDEDEEDEAFGDSHGAGSSSRRSGGDERIFGLGEDGIEGSKAPTGPMVIPSMPNRDWRQSSMARQRRQPGFIPEQAGPSVIKPEDLVERSNDGEVQAGLQVVKREPAVDLPIAETSTSMGTAAVKKEEEPDLESIEERARKALLDSAANPDGEEAARFRDMVIGNADDSNWMERPADEADAFRRDVLTRPEESTMEDYEHTPIEAFGAALLRGMGWNPDKTNGQAVHVPKRRPAGLGLGATAKVISEDDSKNKKNSRKLKEEALGKGYLPVIKRELPSSSTSSDMPPPAPSNGGTSRGSRQTTRSPSPDRRRRQQRPEDDDRRRRDDDGSRRRDTDRDRDRDRERSRYESSSSRGESSRRYNNDDDDRRGSGRSERDRETSSRYKEDSRPRERERERARDSDDRYRERESSMRERFRDQRRGDDERDRDRRR